MPRLPIFFLSVSVSVAMAFIREIPDSRANVRRGQCEPWSGPDSNTNRVVVQLEGEASQTRGDCVAITATLRLRSGLAASRGSPRFPSTLLRAGSDGAKERLSGMTAKLHHHVNRANCANHKQSEELRTTMRKAYLISPAMWVSLLFCIANVAFAAEGPYGGTPAPIPGTVKAENYDTGGQGVAYNVTSVNGSDNGYRSDGVDLETTSAPGGGNDIGWTAAGQWFRFTVNVAAAGTYNVTFEVASPTAVTDGFHLSNSSGTNLTGSVNVPATGGYQDWTTVKASVTLPAGQQILTWNQDNGGYNLYSAAFASSGSGGGSTLTTGVFYNLVNENSGSCIDDTASGTRS